MMYLLFSVLSLRNKLWQLFHEDILIKSFGRSSLIPKMFGMSYIKFTSSFPDGIFSVLWIIQEKG